MLVLNQAIETNGTREVPVSILVLMDVGLKRLRFVFILRHHWFVSILVLMDVGLKQKTTKKETKPQLPVSILVLMDVGLKPHYPLGMDSIISEFQSLF